MKARFHIAAVLAFAMPIQMQAAQEADHVQIWTGGDDGLTQRLRYEMEKGVSESGVFQLVNREGMKADDFIILIPTGVSWAKDANGLVVTAKAEFSRANRKLDEVTVTCREEALQVCAAQIVSAAKTAAAK
jgi:hypothetical protein